MVIATRHLDVTTRTTTAKTIQPSSPSSSSSSTSSERSAGGYEWFYTQQGVNEACERLLKGDASLRHIKIIQTSSSSLQCSGLFRAMASTSTSTTRTTTRKPKTKIATVESLSLIGFGNNNNNNNNNDDDDELTARAMVQAVGTLKRFQMTHVTSLTMIPWLCQALQNTCHTLQDLSLSFDCDNNHNHNRNIIPQEHQQQQQQHSYYGYQDWTMNLLAALAHQRALQKLHIYGLDLSAMEVSILPQVFGLHLKHSLYELKLVRCHLRRVHSFCRVLAAARNNGMGGSHLQILDLSGNHIDRLDYVASLLRSGGGGAASAVGEDSAGGGLVELNLSSQQCALMLDQDDDDDDDNCNYRNNTNMNMKRSHYWFCRILAQDHHNHNRIPRLKRLILDHNVMSKAFAQDLLDVLQHGSNTTLHECSTLNSYSFTRTRTTTASATATATMQSLSLLSGKDDELSQLWKQIQYFTALNQAGRCWFQQQQQELFVQESACSNSSNHARAVLHTLLLPRALARVSSQPSLLYGLLQEQPAPYCCLSKKLLPQTTN